MYLFCVGEELVDGRHDFRRPCAEELAEAMLWVFLSFLFVFKDGRGPVGFIDSANGQRPNKNGPKYITNKQDAYKYNFSTILREFVTVIWNYLSRLFIPNFLANCAIIYLEINLESIICLPNSNFACAWRGQIAVWRGAAQPFWGLLRNLSLRF